MAPWLEPAHISERHGKADGPMAAHADISDIVEEDHASGARGVARLAQQRPDDRVMSVRLVDGEAAEMIELGGEAGKPLGKRAVAKRRAAVNDHACRLAFGVG